MKKRRYTVGAAFADFYSLGIIIGGIEAIFVALLHRPISLGMSFLMVFITILAVIVYHASISPKIRVRSPGEVMMGGKIVDSRKEWTNPFGRNRTMLFTLFFLALIYASNSWDSITDENLYATLTLPVVFVRIVALFILFSGLVWMGSGRANGGYLIALYYLISAIGLWTAKSVDARMLSFSSRFGVYMIVMAIVAVVLARYYGRAPAPAKEKPPGATLDQS